MKRRHRRRTAGTQHNKTTTTRFILLLLLWEWHCLVWTRESACVVSMCLFHIEWHEWSQVIIRTLGDRHFLAFFSTSFHSSTTSYERWCLPFWTNKMQKLCQVLDKQKSTSDDDGVTFGIRKLLYGIVTVAVWIDDYFNNNKATDLTFQFVRCVIKAIWVCHTIVGHEFAHFEVKSKRLFPTRQREREKKMWNSPMMDMVTDCETPLSFYCYYHQFVFISTLCLSVCLRQLNYLFLFLLCLQRSADFATHTPWFLNVTNSHVAFYVSNYFGFDTDVKLTDWLTWMEWNEWCEPVNCIYDEIDNSTTRIHHFTWRRIGTSRRTAKYEMWHVHENSHRISQCSIRRRQHIHTPIHIHY